MSYYFIYFSKFLTCIFALKCGKNLVFMRSYHCKRQCYNRPYVGRKIYIFNKFQKVKQVALKKIYDKLVTHHLPVLSFYTPWKHKKPFYGGYKKGTLGAIVG